MSKSTALLDLRWMEEAAQQACVSSAGMDRHACLVDRKTRHAVLFTLLLIGEAAERLLAKRPDFTGRFDDMPWRAMKGMRNRIVYAYQDLDHDTVWTTVDQDLRRLIDALSAASRVASLKDKSGSAGAQCPSRPGELDRKVSP